VIEAMDAESIYDVPIHMRKEKLADRVLSKLKLTKSEPDLTQWKEFLGRLKNPTEETHIGLVGKYVELHDAYKSIVEAFTHAGAANECEVHIRWIHSEEIDPLNVGEHLEGLDGVLVAPGFGERGIEGKTETIRYLRENNIPFLGICLGLQCAVTEFARNVLNMPKAASTEINPKTPDPVIDLMEEQKKISDKGGTMRLGAYTCTLKKGSKVHGIYGKLRISERHRHRYEFNNRFIEEFENAGMIAVGKNEETNLVEIFELKSHPWFVGVQFHPELKSTVLNPHPLFVRFVEAALKYRKVSFKKETINI